jgi:hypothetical protein
MTRKDKKSYAQKYPNSKVDERIAQAIRFQLLEGGLFCAIAFKIARDLSIPPREVGKTADLLEIPILKCQLGLMGYPPQGKIVKPAESVTPALEEAIQKELVDGRIPCANIFSLADRLRIPKMVISSACEKLKIKISSCQLGMF